MIDIQDAINERIEKIKALTTYFSAGNVDCGQVGNICLEEVMATIHDFLEEIECLYKRLCVEEGSV